MQQHLILLFGPPAVGKMTVGQEIAELTGFKLFHNHMSLELANQFFDWSTPNFQKIDRLVRFGIFDIVAKSDLPGFIFTFVWALDLPREADYLDEIISHFRPRGFTIHHVELQASLDTRLARNKTENRLRHKPSKRNLSFSDQLLQHDEANHRMQSLEGEHPERKILRVDTEGKLAHEVAQIIVQELGIATI